MSDQYLLLFNLFKFNFGRLISHSKSEYIKNHPNDNVVFNARIFQKEIYEKYKNSDIKDFFKGMDHEIWYGDLNLSDKETIDSLHIIADKIGSLYITSEHGELKLIIVN